jgi:hypothetical protein
LVMEFIEITSVPFNIPLMHFFGRLRGKWINLTGESLPVTKLQPKHWLQTLDFNLKSIKSNRRLLDSFCFRYVLIQVQGCKVGSNTLKINDHGSKQIPNRRISSSCSCRFQHHKGSLVRSMMFPKPNNFQFYNEFLQNSTCFGYFYIGIWLVCNIIHYFAG